VELNCTIVDFTNHYCVSRGNSANACPNLKMTGGNPSVISYSHPKHCM